MIIIAIGAVLLVPNIGSMVAELSHKECDKGCSFNA